MLIEPVPILKGDILDIVLSNLGFDDFMPADPSTQNKAMKYIELGAMQLEANGVRVGWMAAEDPTNPDTGNESGIPVGLLLPFSSWVAVFVGSAINLPVSQEARMMARMGPQTMMKFNWETSTPKLRLRGSSPIGSGNTKYRFMPNFIPDNIEYIDVENGTNLNELLTE